MVNVLNNETFSLMRLLNGKRYHKWDFLNHDYMKWKTFSLTRLSNFWENGIENIFWNVTFSLTRIWNPKHSLWWDFLLNETMSSKKFLNNETLSLMRLWSRKSFHQWYVLIIETTKRRTFSLMRVYNQRYHEIQNVLFNQKISWKRLWNQKRSQ